jgi:hypothetical protein
MNTDQNVTIAENPNAKAFYANYLRDVDDLSKFMLVFNQRYGKFLVGGTIIKPLDCAGIMMYPATDGSILNQTDGSIVFEKSIFAEIVAK